MSRAVRAPCSWRRRLALAFLLLPLVAIFLRVPPGELVAQLGNDVVLDALRVTLKTNADRAGAHPPRRDAGRLPHRDAARSAGARS